MTPETNSGSLRDRFRRPLTSLRISVTDRCNLRCQYCMPEEEYTWLPRRDLLSFEELSTLVDVFTGLGVDKLRLTGGEPLLRRDLHELVHLLAQKSACKDLALTTNGMLLRDQAADLKSAGLGRLTVSIDTLQPERFQKLTRRDALQDVLEGVEVARSVGFENIKLDTVAMRGVNDDELIPLMEYAASIQAELRFIEYMDVGGATHWSEAKVLARDAILEQLRTHYGAVEPEARNSSAPANTYLLPSGQRFGVIASTTAPFCDSCDRSRLTADGLWFLCLYAPSGLDLRTPLREGASAEELTEILRSTWSLREDRGAWDRLSQKDRQPLADAGTLRDNPHWEMHTRGG